MLDSAQSSGLRTKSYHGAVEALQVDGGITGYFIDACHVNYPHLPSLLLQQSCNHITVAAIVPFTCEYSGFPRQYWTKLRNNHLGTTKTGILHQDKPRHAEPLDSPS